MSYFKEELKISFNSLQRKRGFVATVIITLGITLGALITFFNLNHVLLLKPLPYPEQQRLHLTQHILSNENQSILPLVPGLLHTYQRQQSFEKMTILSTGQEFLTSHPEQPKLAVTFTTPEYFELLAAPMALGRAFSQNAGLNQNNPVVVLSYQSWQKWYQGNPDVVGSKLQLRNISYTIIGVTAESFSEPEIIDDTSDLWAPWDFNGMNENLQQSWNNPQGNIAGLGKLYANSDTNKEQAQLSHTLNTAYQNYILGTDNPSELAGNIKLQLKPLQQHLLGNSQLQALLLFGAVFAMLVIACVNMINMFYSRTIEKQRLFAIQAALGARKKHLFGAVFAETLMLMLASCVVGLLLAMWGIDLVKVLGQSQFKRLHELGLDTATLFFSVLLSVILAVIFAVLSTRVVNHDNLRQQLQSSGKGSGLQIASGKRNTLIVSQIFLASFLLVGSSMVLDKALSVIYQPLGYDSSLLSSFMLDERAGLIADDEMARRDQIMNEINTRIKQLPQVDSIAPSFNTAIGYNMTMTATDLDHTQLGSFPTNFVASDYFSTMQLPMLEGRAFTSQEIKERAPLVIVSQSMAEVINRKNVNQGKSILGMKITLGGGEFRTVIGMVADIFDPSRESSNQGQDAYLPHAPWNIHFIMRLKPGTELSRQQLVTLIHDINPGLRVADYTRFTEQHNKIIRHDKITAAAAAGLTLIALLLAGTGIFGVLSYNTQMRRYELGVRMSLGAKTKQITLLVLKDNIRPVSIGLMLSGFLLTAIFGLDLYFRWFEGYGLKPLLLAVPIMLFTCLLASYLPIRSMLQSDPIKALRNEYT